MLFKRKIGKFYRNTTYYIKRKPLTSFFLALLLLFGLITAGNLLAPKEKLIQKPEIIKQVDIFRVEEKPKISMQAKIEKSGVIKINALAPGIIQSINFLPGEIVNKGQVLLNMSSNYQGGNAASIQRSLAQKQYQNTKDTFDTQKDIIAAQKALAENVESNVSQLRNITDQSLQDTRDLINLNQSIVDTLSTNQTNLEQSNNNGINDAAILQLKQQKALTQSGLNQLRSALRQSEFQASGDKPPAEMAKLQKDLTLKQLNIQQKALELGLEVSRLQLALSQINESLYYPVSPFAGIIQRIYVKEGQNVNPGTPLFTISSIDDPITAVVILPRDIANTVSSTEQSTLFINGKEIEATPHFISTEATDGALYSIIYIIPDEFSKDLTEGESIAVSIPIGLQTDTAVRFIPLDSIFQSINQSTVLVAKDDKAASKEVVLGNVFGKFVEVKSGLSENDLVILNRNVLVSDKISIQK